MAADSEGASARLRILEKIIERSSPINCYSVIASSHAQAVNGASSQKVVEQQIFDVDGIGELHQPPAKRTRLGAPYAAAIWREFYPWRAARATQLWPGPLLKDKAALNRQPQQALLAAATPPIPNLSRLGSLRVRKLSRRRGRAPTPTPTGHLTAVVRPIEANARERDERLHR